jgi:hypothetical protein
MTEKKNILVYPVILHPEDEGYSVEILILIMVLGLKART